MSLRHSVTWAFAGQIASVFVSFAGTVIVSRLITPREMGIYTAALAINGLFSVVSSSGANVFLVREREVTTQTLRNAFSANLLLSAALAAFVLLSSFWAKPWFGDAQVGPVLRILALTPLVNVFSFCPAAMLHRDMQFKTAALVAILNVFMSNLVMILAALAGAGPMSPAIAGVVAASSLVAVYCVTSRRYLAFRPSLRGSRALVLFSLRMLSISGLSQLAGYACDILFGRLLGMAALGIYSRASNLTSLVFINFYGTASRVIFAQLSRDWRERGEIGETFARGYQLILGVLWPVLAGIAVLSRPAVLTIYGERWLDAAEPLSLLMTGTIVTLGFGMCWELFVIRDRLRDQSRFELIRSIFSIIFFAVGCHWGMTGAATARVVDAALGFVIYIGYTSLLTGLAKRSIARIIAVNLLLAGVTIAPSALLMASTGWDAHVSLLLVAPVVLVGGFCWLALLAYLDHPLMVEIRSFSHRFRLMAALGIFNRLERRARGNARP